MNKGAESGDILAVRQNIARQICYPVNIYSGVLLSDTFCS